MHKPVSPLILSFCLIASLVASGCSGTAYTGDRSGFTARPIDQLPSVASVNVESRIAANPEAEAIMLRNERAMEHLFHLPMGGDWFFVDDRLHQYIVMDEENDRWTTVRLRMDDKARLEDYFGRVTSPDGIVQTFSESDLIEDRDGDDRVFSFAYPGVEKGSIVEESFRLRYRFEDDYLPPLSHDVSLQYDVPVDTLKFRHVAPETWGLQIKKIAANRPPPFYVDRTTEPGKTIIVYEGSNIPAIPDEPYAPFFKEVANYMQFQITEIYVRGEPVYQTATEWSVIADRFNEYALRSGTVWSDPAANAARRAVDESAPDSVKLATVIDWVQENITLDQSSDHDEFTEVLRNNRGNWYMITGLTLSMLDRVGITSQFLLINPASEGYFDNTYISGEQFYVPALNVSIDDTDYVVFPYLDGLPIDYIPEAYQGRSAMQVAESGLVGMVDLPRRAASEHATDENYVVTIGEDGVLTVEEEVVLRGAAAYLTRRHLEDFDDGELEDEMREMLTYTDGDINDFEYTISHQENHDQPLEIKLEYSIDNLVTVTPEEILFQTSGLLSPATTGRFKVNPQQRVNPVRIYNDEIKNKLITIRFPEHWSLSTNLEDVEDSNRFGEVRGTYRVSDGEIVADQQIRLRSVSSTPSGYRTLLQLTGSESLLYIPTLVFEVGQPGD